MTAPQTSAETSVPSAALPAPGRPPVAAPTAGYVGAVIALMLLFAGAVALRDAAVIVGWLRGSPWTTTVISGLDGLTHRGWMTAVGVVAILIGLWTVAAALRPRRRTAFVVPARTSVWIAKPDLARLAGAAAETVPGVLAARAAASLRTVKVTADVTAGDPAVKAAIATAVADAIGGFITAPRIKVRTRSGEN